MIHQNRELRADGPTSRLQLGARARDAQLKRLIGSSARSSYSFEFKMRLSLLALVAIGASAGAQAPVNENPNPYQTVVGLAKLQEGSAWGSTSDVDIDKDGTSVLVAERC